MKSKITISIITALLLPLTLLAASEALEVIQYNDICISVEQLSERKFQVDFNADEGLISALDVNEELPTITRWIALSPSGDVTAKRLETHTVEIASEFTEIIQSLVDNEASVTYNPCHTTAISVGAEWVMKDIRFVPVTFHPVVSQRDNEYSLINHLSVELTIDGALVDLSKLSPTVRQMWGSLLLNRDDPRRDQDGNNCASVCIYVLPNDRRVWEVMQPIYELRRLEGFRVDTLIHNGSAVRIKEQIQAIYDDGKLPVEYVCLIGDFGGEFSVPAFINGTSDYPYGLLEGSDPLPEAAVGRISYNSIAELERIVNKILSYELEPDLENEEPYRRAAVAAGNARSGFSTILINRWIRDLLFRNNYAAVDTFWWTMNEGVAAFMRNSFDRGAQFVNYRGWTGLEDWTVNEVLRLNNDHLPVVLLFACNAGDFQGIGSGFTEALLKADGGAIGAIGSVGFQSRVDCNNALASGYFRGVVEDGVCRLGWTLNRAKLELFAAYAVVSMDRVSDHAYWTNLMGDPATVIWRGMPQEVQLQVPEVVRNGDGELTVTVTNRDDEPISGARVGLYKPGEITSAAYTNNQGEAVLEFDPARTGEGQAFITASGDMIVPNTEEIEFRVSDNLLIYQSRRIVEDGANPHVGNGDGIPNPRETIGLYITVQNRGTVAIEGGVNFTLSANHDFCRIINENFAYNGRINPNGVVEASFLIRIETNFPGGQAVPFILTANNNNQEWMFEFSITGSAPYWEIIEVELDNEPIPLNWIDLSVTFTNSGQKGVLPFEAELISLNDFAEVHNAIVQYDTLRVFDTLDANQDFLIMLIEDTPYNELLDFQINVHSEDDYSAVIPFTIQVDPRPDEYPCGPDDYGYYAIDMNDEEWSNLAPIFNWVEINPERGGHGADTGMLDQSEDDDESVVLDLPFTFTYYGEDFDELTVCTNGWAAFGDQSDYVDFRNTSIGAPQGPLAQLCPWWDDLYQPTAEEGVFYFNDEINHRFIIEWYRMKRWIGPAGPGASETFELILYDPLYYATYTGDGDILFQYLEITNEARVDAHGTPYATIGIGSPDDRGGLEYGFWNRWSEGASPVQSRNTILFSTSVYHSYGLVKGRITLAQDNSAVENALVRVTPGSWNLTDVNGDFRIPKALANTPLEICIMKAGCNTITSNLQPVARWDSTEVNFELTRPAIAVNREAFVDTLQDEEQESFNFEISNDGNGELEYNIGFDAHVDNENFIGVRRDDPDELWEQLLNVNVTAATGDGRILGVVFTGDEFIVSGGNNGEFTNYMYRFSAEGDYLGRILQPCHSLWGMHDLAWDGELLYGGSDEWIYSINLETNQVDSIRSPLIPPRAIAVDRENGDYWIANDGAPIHRIDAEGDILETYTHRLRPYGFAWRDDDPESSPLYIFSADGENNLAVTKLNPEQRKFKAVTDLELEDADRAGGAELTACWLGAHWVFTTIVQSPNGDRLVLFDAGLNLDWIAVEPQSGTINPNGSQQCELTMSTIDIAAGEYVIDMVISHNAEGNELRVPIIMTYISEFWAVNAEKPSEYQLNAIYPNPTNGAAMIAYQLPNPSVVNISLIDQTGRQISELVNGEQSAGTHTYSLSANSLPSGIYFVRMTTAGKTNIRKFVILK
ncbi:T9SS type A sorting domain-containing protein [bacterium]|nr:T9SS type A sorting domain-containing protein [bacterium]